MENNENLKSLASILYGPGMMRMEMFEDHDKYVKFKWFLMRAIVKEIIKLRELK